MVVRETEKGPQCCKLEGQTVGVKVMFLMGGKGL